MNAKEMGTKGLIAAALAGLLTLPGAALTQEKQDNAKESPPCWGVNKCKGVGDCGADGCRHSGCHGSNACNRRGFLRIESETCLKIEGGRLTKNLEKPSKN